MGIRETIAIIITCVISKFAITQMPETSYELPVIIGLAAIYALAVGGGSWFILSADSRTSYRRRVRARLWEIGTALFAWYERFIHKAAHVFAQSGRRVGILIGIVSLRWQVIGIALGILITPAVLVQIIGSDPAPGAFGDAPTTTDPVIAELLRGERLVPPAPMPPELFSTKEVERDRQEIVLASREWNLLDSDFRHRLLAVYHLMAQRGYQMTLLEGYRTPERQAALARLGTHVTHAGAYQSYHQYGLAADSAFYKDGKLVISEKDPWAMEGYRLYGQFAESAGLVWGGKWQLMDFGHVELRRHGSIAKSR